MCCLHFLHCIIVRQVIRYVCENINKNIASAEVADQDGFNISCLSRKFKKELKIELSAFIKKCKLEEAKDFLAFSDKGVSEIGSYLYFKCSTFFEPTLAALYWNY